MMVSIFTTIRIAAVIGVGLLLIQLNFACPMDAIPIRLLNPLMALPSIMQRENRCPGICQYVDRYGDCRLDRDCFVSSFMSKTTPKPKVTTTTAPPAVTFDGGTHHRPLDRVGTTPRPTISTETARWETPANDERDETGSFDQDETLQTTEPAANELSSTVMTEGEEKSSTSSQDQEESTIITLGTSIPPEDPTLTPISDSPVHPTHSTTWTNAEIVLKVAEVLLILILLSVGVLLAKEWICGQQLPRCTGQREPIPVDQSLDETVENILFLDETSISSDWDEDGEDETAASHSQL